MPALPIIANNYLVAQHVTALNELHENVNVFCILDNTGVATESAIATEVAFAYKTRILPFISAAMTLGNTVVTPLDGTTSPTTFTTASAGSTGGLSSGGTVPLSICYGATWQTGHRGRSMRGRSYFSGVIDSTLVHEVARTLTSGQLTLVQNGVSGFVSDLITANLPLMVLSRKLGLSTRVTAARANPGAVEQRRRFEHVAHD